jgi:hypothetical protein
LRLLMGRYLRVSKRIRFQSFLSDSQHRPAKKRMKWSGPPADAPGQTVIRRTRLAAPLQEPCTGQWQIARNCRGAYNTTESASGSMSSQDQYCHNPDNWPRCSRLGAGDVGLSRRLGGSLNAQKRCDHYHQTEDREQSHSKPPKPTSASRATTVRTGRRATADITATIGTLNE